LRLFSTWCGQKNAVFSNLLVRQIPQPNLESFEAFNYQVPNRSECETAKRNFEVACGAQIPQIPQRTVSSPQMEIDK
jgi:hypothetical protein